MASQRIPAGTASPRRRQLLAGGGAALAVLPLGPAARALLQGLPGAALEGARTLWITRPQAQESARCVYWAEGRLQPEGCATLRRLYRDLHAGAEFPIAESLLHLNFAMQIALGRLVGPRPMVLFSGYRTAATNRAVGGSFPNIHGEGAADDFIYEGLTLAENHRFAQLFQIGGLGLYPRRGSLHKDVGRRRSWITPN